MRKKCDNKEEDLNREHPFPRVARYKKGSDINMVILQRLGCSSIPKINNRFHVDIFWILFH